MEHSSTTFHRLEQIWQVVLYAGFSLLCLRFLVAATREMYPDVLPLLVLTVGGLGLSAWRPGAALFAFTISVPLLNGLDYVGLAGLPAPVSLVFSGVFVGGILRQFASRLVGHRLKVKGLKSDLEPITVNPKPSKAMLVTDVLITAVLVSLIVQIVRHQDSPELWKVFWNRSRFGFGDPFYFMTSTFLWLQGLFYFRLLVEGAKEKFPVSSSKYQGPERQREMREKGGEGLVHWSKEKGTEGGAVTAWIQPVFAV